MVTGIESFKEWFKGNESQYAIIGGTACDILMTEEGLQLWGGERVRRKGGEALRHRRLPPDHESEL